VIIPLSSVSSGSLIPGYGGDSINQVTYELTFASKEISEKESFIASHIVLLSE
jgi:hypothetical protein